jgi:3-oxoacyl-[acyl-carrier protein] reductase
MDLGLKDRVAVVTGGSRGIGFACADALAREGAHLVMTGRDAIALKHAAGLIRGHAPVEILEVSGDITHPSEPGRVIDAGLEHFGRLDIVIPNAAGPPRARALEVSIDQLRAALDGSFLAMARLISAALPHLRESDAGRICCIASVTVIKPIASLSLSNVARNALWAWIRDIASELRPSTVTINLLCPGPHSGRRSAEVGITESVGDPADLGKVAAFLCSAFARNISGAAIVVDGGVGANFPE